MSRWFLDENDIDIYLKCTDDVRWHYNKKELVRILNDLETKLVESENKLNQYPYKNDVIEKQYEDLKDGIKFRIENNITDDWEQLYHCFDVLCEKHKARIRDIENGICRIEQLKQQLAEKEDRINWLVEAEFNRKWAKKYVEMRRQEDPMLCLPDSDEVYERYFELKQQLEMKDHTITNLVEDNRASQEWYKKQLADTEAQNKRVLEKLDLLVRSNQELERKLADYEHDLDEAFKLDDIYAEKLRKRHEDYEKMKIEFAVEQLEQLKHDIWTDQQDNGWLDEQVDIYFLTETIDNQIKAIKDGE